MRKGIVRLIVSLFYSFLGLSLLILFSCGDISDDPTATITLDPADAVVAPGDSLVITATVMRAVGLTGPAPEQNVTFTLRTANGGSLDPTTGKTNNKGEIKTTYKAGYNYDSDIIWATLENEAYDVLIIGKTAPPTPPTPTPVTPLSITVAASRTSVTAALPSSTITATLTGDDNVGVTVTFTLPVNNSGATLSPSSAVTDGSGNAQVYYTAGSTNPTVTVNDTVEAAVGSITSAVTITRTP